MSKGNNYKANQALERFSEHLEFEVNFFDTQKINYNLQYPSSGTEIDAIMLSNNVVFIIEIYSGKNSKEAENKIIKFERGMRTLNQAGDLGRLKVMNTSLAQNEKNKSTEKLNIIKKHIDEYGKNYKLIIKKICFFPEIDIDEAIKDERAKKDIYIIDKEIYLYFQEIYKTLGKEYLFRDLVCFLNINESQLEKKSASTGSRLATEKSKKVTRLELQTDRMVMYSTSFAVREIEKLVTVFRIGQKRFNVKGFQRMIKNSRLNKIAKEYLETNETFPNNIIIALNPEIYNKESVFYDKDTEEIVLFREYNSLLIIDGQHRFFSFFKNGDLDRQILVTLIYFKGGINALPEVYKMFYKINHKQERIDPSLSFVLKALIYSDSQERFWFEVFKKLNKTKGIFKNKVVFKERQLRYEDEQSIISVITYGGILRLNKSTNKLKGLEEFYEGKRETSKIKFSYNLLNNYFQLIQEEFIKQVGNNQILQPREIGALMRLIRHFMVRNKDLIEYLGINNKLGSGSRNKKKKKLVKIISLINFDKLINSNLPSSNWAGTEGLILKHIHSNKKERNFGDKEILSKKGKEIFYN